MAKKKAKSDDDFRRCVDCNAVLRLGNSTPLCAPCTRRPGWYKNPITVRMEKEKACAKRAVNLLLGASVPTAKRILRIVHVNTLKNKKIYDIRLLSDELDAITQAELDMDSWDRLYSKIEDFTGVLDASYSEKFGAAIIVQIEKQLDNVALHRTILTMISAHIHRCITQIGS